MEKEGNYEEVVGPLKEKCVVEHY